MPSAVRVVAALFIRGGRVLACRRAPERPTAGRWEFPGGKIEPGETPAAALVREIAEELGVRITVGAEFDRSSTVVAGAEIDLSCLLVTDFAPPPSDSTDHDRLRWCTPEQLSALDWAEPDRPAVTRLLSGEFRFVQESTRPVPRY